MALPFAGLRVIELGTVVSGPFIGSLLADLGAEVIKIEAPGKGDVQRVAGNKKNGVSLWWGTATRNKQCISLDLKSTEGRNTLEKLVRASDVMMENYRPGAIEKLGFGWKAVHAMNPGLVMASISGFGQTGPQAGWPGFGKILEGVSGVVPLTGNAGDQPLMIGFSLADTCTGLFATLGIVMGLYHRDVQGGTGVYVDAALYEPLFRMLDCQLPLLARTGTPPERRGSNDPYGWGLDSSKRPRFVPVRAKNSDWFLLRIARTSRLATQFPQDKALAEWAAVHETEALRHAVMAAGDGIAPVMDGLRAASDAYLRVRGDVLDTNDPKVGKISVPGFIGTGVSPADRFLDPAVGEHTSEVLARLPGMKPSVTCSADAKARGDAMHGLVVAEVASTPGACFAACLLADFNATVYTCETLPDGSAMRALEPRDWWQVIARNKSSIAIDPRDVHAVRDMQAVLSHADVVITDVPPATHASDPWLRHLPQGQKRPMVVSIVAPGADRPEAWKWSVAPEFAAAVSGMMALTGQADGPPLQPEFPLAENLAATLAAMRTVAELRRAKASGDRPGDIVVPLHQAVHRMIEWQVPVATAQGRAELRVGNEFPMSFTISNVFKAGDGAYFTLSAGNDANAAKLLEMIGGASLRDDPRMASMQSRLPHLQEIYGIVEQWAGARDMAEIVAEAAKYTVSLGVIFDAWGVLNHPHLNARGSIVKVKTSEGTELPMPTVLPHVVGWNVSVRSVGPALGAQSAQILRACGVGT